jgi:hypothetical protein
MTLPPNFSHWEHLQDTIRREHNKTVARYFRDLGEDWEPDISTPRRALRTAVTINDQDTDVMTLIRLYLFYETLGYGRKRLGNFFGIPSQNFEESFEGKPEVFLYFSQDSDAVPDGEAKIDAEYSFRLTDETSETMTEVKAKTLAQKIKNTFIEGNKGYVFTKGKNICSYRDKNKGYQLAIYASTEAEGEQVVRKILSLGGDIFEADKFSVSVPKKNSVNKPTTTKKVYGKNRKATRWRPTANVRFRYAYLYIHGLNEVVYLVDTTNYHSALVY